MNEMDKLDEMLTRIGIKHERHEINIPSADQIVVYGKDKKIMWDAICGTYSYGSAEGLIEVMGEAVVCKEDGDSVKGYLTAEDVMNRYIAYGMHKIIEEVNNGD